MVSWNLNLKLKEIEMSDLKPVKIEGTLFWSRWMNEFNTKFNDDNTKYETTIGELSAGAVAALTALGVKVKNKPEMGDYIVCKSKFAFEPKDVAGKVVDIKDIGNGTRGVFLVSSYTHKLSGKHGNAPSLKMITITDLKKYEPEAAVAEEDAVL
jgi:hypothetical protein